jgi:hypothetical protein
MGLPLVAFKSTMLLVILAVTALFAMVGTTIAAQKVATPRAQSNIALGGAEVKKMMLPLMDQDKDGKASKQDFMTFMEAEFDRLDNTKEGELDVKKLTQPPAQPVRGFRGKTLANRTARPRQYVTRPSDALS